MNTKTLRSIAISAAAAVATLAFTVMSVPTQANALCLHRGIFSTPVYAPRDDGQMVQLGVPGLRSMVFSTDG
ncbi:MAG: hypothetical protein K0Q76_2882 [Panacagrimonas sp.]|jgi:hypothetical protein|nr:hypothetical protein [Panacagrimonas sp.]MCC2657774.1 hypothetical protein [Panacagrimonas sp.]